MNDLLNEKLNTKGITLDDTTAVLGIIDNINKKATELPATIKKLKEAKENLMYEKETEISRGGNTVLSSMDADEY